MIKKLIKILAFLTTAFLLTLTLYFLDYIPFLNFDKEQISTTISENDNNLFQSGKEENEKLISEKASLPEELKEQKVIREKSYDEIMKRAFALEQSGFPSLAIAEYQNAFMKNPTNIAPLLHIGEIHLKTKNFDKAEKAFLMALEKNKTDSNAIIGLARSEFSNRNFEKSLKTLLNDTNPNDLNNYYRALLYAYSDNHQEAKRYFKLLNSSDSETVKNRLSPFLKAYETFDYNSDSPAIFLRVLLARAYNLAEEYEIAIPLLLKITADKLDYRDAWILMGYAYLKTYKYADAIEAFQRARTLDPTKPETAFFMGLAYYSVNDYVNAEKYLIRAKELGYSPTVQIDQKLAEIYLLMRKYKEAAEKYKIVAENYDVSVDYFIRPVWLYLEKTNEPKKALELAKIAEKKFSEEAMSYNLTGWTQIHLKDFKSAESSLAKAMSLNPNLDAVYLNYGILYKEKKEYEKAANFFRKAHRLGNGNGISEIAARNYNELLNNIYYNSTSENMRASIF